MARKPSEPSPKSTGSKSGGGGRQAEHRATTTERARIAGEVQVVGEHSRPTEPASPVAVTRLRKADGRALTLYSAGDADNAAAGDRA
jgi:hypothetical protein